MDKNHYVEVVEIYGNTVFRVAYQYCGNKSDAEDITQNVFIKLYQSKKCFEDEEYLKRWLIRVAINEAKNLCMSFWKKNMFSLEDTDKSETYEFSKEEYTKLHDAIQNLLPKYRVVVHLYYFENYSVREISKILKIKETTVQTQLMRARTKLKEQLKEEWEDE